MASIVRENLKIFSHTTSVKGIPKIVKSTLLSSKILWMTATVTCLSVAAYNVYSLSAGYLSYQTLTTITEMQRRSVFPYQMTTLVCDNQPYNLQAFKELDIPDPTEYFKMLRQTLGGGNGADETNIKQIANELFSSTGYRQYLTEDQVDMLVRKQGDLVIACQYLRREGLFTQYIECNDTNMAIIRTTVPGFFNCFVIENKLAETDMFIVGLELLLYMEVNKPVPVLVDETHKIPLRNFQKIGVTILAIPYSTAQLLAKTSVQVIPGRDTELKIGAEVRNRLVDPWGTCTDQDFLSEGQFGNGNRIVYTYDACMDECYEIELKSRCNCRDVTAMGLMTVQYHDVIFCGDIKMGYDWLVKNMTCMFDVREHFVALCREKCSNACMQTTFQVTSSAAQWPQPMESASFYYSFMNNESSVRQSFNIEYGYGKDKLFNETNITDLNNLFYFIRQRFTKVKLFFPSETYRELKDHIKTSFSQLLSQVGSILNFWTGITVLLIVELADCVLKMIHQWSQTKQKKPERPTVNHIEVTPHDKI